METIKIKCAITGAERKYTLLAEGIVYETFKNEFGNVFIFFNYNGSKVKKIGSTVAEYTINDITEIAVELQESVGFSKSQSLELAEKVNEIFNSVV